MSTLSEANLARIQANRAEALRRKHSKDSMLLTPAGDETLTFGKHAGKRFFEVANSDEGYCRWVKSQPNPTGLLLRFRQYLERLQPETQGSAAGAAAVHSSSCAKRGADEDHAGNAKRQKTSIDQLQKIARPLSTQRREFRLQQGYLDLMKSGQKRWEGRLKIGQAAGVSLGCCLTFSSGREDLEMVVRSIRNYASFQSMLEDLGVQNCLPGVKTVADGVRIYHGFPNYAEREKQVGVVAFEVMKPGCSFTLGM